MSYKRKITETMVICNDDEKTKKVVHAIKEYIWDTFNNVKIESLDELKIYLRCDDLTLNWVFPYENLQGEDLNLNLSPKILTKSFKLFKI